MRFTFALKIQQRNEFRALSGLATAAEQGILDLLNVFYPNNSSFLYHRLIESKIVVFMLARNRNRLREELGSGVRRYPT